MPTLLTCTPPAPPPHSPPRKRWTREQCVPLEQAGIFEREKLELVDGELISKMGKNRPHVNAFTLMQYWLLEAFGKPFVNVEAPIDVAPGENSWNEPEPDLIVLNQPSSNFVSANPQPADVQLLVEIADSSLNFDLTVKARLYARAGIVEYWVLDVTGRRLYCHRNVADGEYASVEIYGEDESVSPLANAGAKFSPKHAFGL